MQLTRKVAIITGAAHGIGFATAERLVNEGATVVLSDIRGHEEGAARLRSRNGNAIGIYGDVSSDESVAALVAQTVERFGTVHILVNNAASESRDPGPFEKQSSEDWKRIYDVNAIGTFRMCRAVSPHMRAQKWGRIVNVTSGTALKGSAGLLHYIASKGAIISMTRSLSTEFGTDNVLVNAVAPGFTITERNRDKTDIIETFGAKAVDRKSVV